MAPARGSNWFLRSFLLVVAVSCCMQHAPSKFLVASLPDPAPPPHGQGKEFGSNTKVPSTEALLQVAADAWAARNFTHAAISAVAALGPSKGKDRRVWAMLRQYQQYLTRRAENTALRAMFRGLISTNQATLDDLLEFSYIAMLGDGDTSQAAPGEATFDDAKRVASIIERFRNVKGLTASLSSSYRAKVHFAMGRLLDALGNHALKLEKAKTVEAAATTVDGAGLDATSIGLFYRAFAEFAAGNAAAVAPITDTNAAGKGGVLPDGKVSKSVADCLATMHEVQDVFTAASLAELRAPPAPTSTSRYTHVFIVGFPRSGTSLVDQIVAAHPNAWSRGEHSELQYVASWLAQAAAAQKGEDLKEETLVEQFTRSRLRWPHLPPEERAKLFQALSKKGHGNAAGTLSDALLQSVADALDEQWETRWAPPTSNATGDLGTSSAAVAAAVATTTTHVVSCVSFDINLLWLLPTFFPKARVVFVERCPLDVALSNFVANFVLHDSAWCGLHYAFDFAHLATVQAAYRRLLRHWSTALGGGPGPSTESPGAGNKKSTEVRAQTADIRVTRLSYESLVEDPAGAIPGLLDFLGLPMAESCMRHHEPLAGEEKRWKGVSTASLAQVNEPIHGSRIGRWKRYRHHVEQTVELGAFVGEEEDKAACGIV